MHLIGEAGMNVLNCALAFAVSVFASTAVAEPLKLVSWNVANLAEKPDVALRGHERNAAEYQAIAGIIAGLDPDIIALQEMGSIPSAAAILPKGYKLVFEDRCMANSAACQHDVEDIFTAIAYKDSLGDLKPVQVPELGVDHVSECPGDIARPVRGGVGLEVDHGGKKYLIVSVHLKASCKDNAAEGRPAQQDDCATQKKQIAILVEWMGKQKQAGFEVIMAGDFNRELLNSGDHVTQQLKAFDANIRFEPTVRECWNNFQFPFNQIKNAATAKFPEIAADGGSPVPFGPKSNAKIDFFLISGTTAGDDHSSLQFPAGDSATISEMATDYVKQCDGKPSKFPDGGVLTFSEVEPSDHCPISMTLR
jgi:endonuclease/exonuclease/phosphatase family metal-dependent hydrolase